MIRSTNHLFVHVIQMAFKTKGIIQALQNTRRTDASMGDDVRQTNNSNTIPYEGKKFIPKLYQIGGFTDSRSIPNSNTIRKNRQGINARTENNVVSQIPRKDIMRKPQNASS